MYVLVYTTNSYAQIPEAPTAALSPNAASLGLYGDIPVSLFTGTPDISIPLYDVKVSNFTLPISLNYHASGVRVDQRPGWTGLGWTLFAGGVITRSVNDLIDEYNNSNIGGQYGYYYNHQVLNTDTWDQRTYLLSVAGDPQKYVKDKTPDEFSFNFPGYSGKFYLDHTGKWVVQCNKPVKVELNLPFLPLTFFDARGTLAETLGYSPCFNGFTVITEDGTKYVFGGDKDAIDFSVNFFGQYSDYWKATAWYLTQIILPTQQEINFTYERNEYNNQIYIAVHHNLSSKVSGGGWVACSTDIDYSSVENSYTGKLIAPVYLKTITTDNVIVAFNKSVSDELKYNQSVYAEEYYKWSNNNMGHLFLPLLNTHSIHLDYPNSLNKLKWYKLDSIEINPKNQPEALKTIAFTYNNSSSQRLTLGNVTESGKKSYIFSYNNIEDLPNYLANKSDHWGFFNNTEANLNNYSNYYGYRNPNATYTKYGVLTKIIYPTGGYTEFEFEPHYYGKQIGIERWKTDSIIHYSTNQLAGGLRIKQIRNSATPTDLSPIVKEYYYVSDYLQNKTNASQSSGILGGKIQYYFTNYTVYASGNSDLQKNMSIFSSISVLPSCNNGAGSHIGYTEAIEKNPDNSFTRYQFSNFDNGYMDESAEAIIQESRTPYEPYNSKASDRGLLLVREDYNANGEKLKSKNIFYEKDVVLNNYVRAMMATSKKICPNSEESYVEGSAYKFYTYLLRPQTEIDTIFDSMNGSLKTETQYTYNTQKLLSEASILQSDGKKQKTKFLYPFENQNGVDGDVMKKMTDKHILSDYTEKIVYFPYKFSHSYKECKLPLSVALGLRFSPASLVYPDDRINITSCLCA